MTAAILVLAVVIGAAVARDALAGSNDPAQAVAPEDERVLVDGREIAFPTPAPSADAPLGTPPEVPDDDRFVAANVQVDGAIVTWDPCRPIRYVVGPGAAPEGAEGMIDEAMAEIEAATGLTFVAEGPTEEPVSEDRPPIQSDRYGDRWVPVLVAWTDPGVVPALAGAVGGWAGPTAFARPGGLLAYTTGSVLLDGPEAAQVMEEPDGRDEVRGVVMHELAHLVGLEHIDDPTELMYPVSQPGVTTFGPGDRAGLARLGRGPCIPEL